MRSDYRSRYEHRDEAQRLAAERLAQITAGKGDKSGAETHTFKQAIANYGGEERFTVMLGSLRRKTFWFWFAFWLWHPAAAFIVFLIVGALEDPIFSADGAGDR